ncbi:uncharacterized protein [Notamacropus eugenii]|uniref:uncharacterized protein n=1 Tax=Notamacropus eugenii TaxID=9315 RepID=UPI003B6770D9
MGEEMTERRSKGSRTEPLRKLTRNNPSGGREPGAPKSQGEEWVAKQADDAEKSGLGGKLWSSLAREARSPPPETTSLPSPLATAPSNRPRHQCGFLPGAAPAGSGRRHPQAAGGAGGTRARSVEGTEDQPRVPGSPGPRPWPRPLLWARPAPPRPAPEETSSQDGSPGRARPRPQGATSAWWGSRPRVLVVSSEEPPRGAGELPPPPPPPARSWARAGSEVGGTPTAPLGHSPGRMTSPEAGGGAPEVKRMRRKWVGQRQVQPFRPKKAGRDVTERRGSAAGPRLEQSRGSWPSFSEHCARVR